MEDSVITPDSLRRRSGQFDLSSILSLEYAGCGVRELANLEPCISLVRADFSGNRIRGVGCLGALPLLEHIDLSNNSIDSTEGFGDLLAVKVLRLQGNQIASLDKLAGLEGAGTLKQLFLKDPDGGRKNPVCDVPGYAAAVLRLCPQLAVLDGERIDLRRAEEEFVALEASLSTGAVVLPPSLPWIAAAAVELPPKSDNAVLRRLAREVQDATTACDNLDAEAAKLIQRVKAIVK